MHDPFMHVSPKQSLILPFIIQAFTTKKFSKHSFICFIPSSGTNHHYLQLLSYLLPPKESLSDRPSEFCSQMSFEYFNFLTLSICPSSLYLLVTVLKLHTSLLRHSLASFVSFFCGLHLFLCALLFC